MPKNNTFSMKALNAAKPSEILIDHEQRGLRVAVSQFGFRAFYNARHNGRAKQVNVGYIGTGGNNISINTARERVRQLASNANAHGLLRAIEMYENESVVINADLTTDDAFEYYAAHQKKECTPRTQKRDRAFYQNHIQPAIGSKPLLSKEAAAFISDRIDEHLATRRKHAKQILTTCTAMVKHSVKAKALCVKAHDPYAELWKKHRKDMMNGKGLGAVPLRLDQMPSFMQWLNGIALDGPYGEVRFLMEYMLRTGCRPIEIYTAKWDSFLNLELGVWRQHVAKVEEPRIIRIPTVAIKLVMQWRKIQAEKALSKGKPMSQYVMPLKTKDKHIGEARVGFLLKEMRDLGVSSSMHTTPYTTRKTLRTQLSSVLDCPAEIGELILGHTQDDSDVQHVYDHDKKVGKMYKFLVRWESVLADYAQGEWEKHDDSIEIRAVIGDYS